MKTHLSPALGILFILSAFATSALAQCPPVEIAVLESSGNPGGPLYGRSVAIFGGTVVVGADDTGDQSGQTYVYSYDGVNLVEEAALIPQGLNAGDQFGRSVDTAAGSIVIGAYGDDGNGANAGSAYFYRYNGNHWTLDTTLKAFDAWAGDMFGHAVSVLGTTAVVGAFGDSNFGLRTGAAYVVKDDGTEWVIEQKLTASDGALFQQFGAAVDNWGNNIIVGAYGSNDNGTMSGATYIFHDNGTMWQEQAKLLPSDGSANDNFGHAVAMSGTAVIVGAPHDFPSGSAYIFRFDGTQWIEEAKLLPTGTSFDENFGTAVEITGNLALVGATHEDISWTDSGSSYFYKYENGEWIFKGKMQASESFENENFGGSVSISGTNSVVGAAGGPSGEAYIFDLASTDCASSVPADKSLSQLFPNHPNPFNPSTVISFDLRSSASVTLQVFDVSGALIATLFDGHASSGMHRMNWNGRDSQSRAVSSGVYYYRLRGKNIDEGRSMILVR